MRTFLNGVEQITQLLANYTNISAVHIISHGGPGSLQLGAMELNSDNLTKCRCAALMDGAMSITTK